MVVFSNLQSKPNYVGPVLKIKPKTTTTTTAAPIFSPSEFFQQQTPTECISISDWNNLPPLQKNSYEVVAEYPCFNACLETGSCTTTTTTTPPGCVDACSNGFSYSSNPHGNAGTHRVVIQTSDQGSVTLLGPQLIGIGTGGKLLPSCYYPDLSSCELWVYRTAVRWDGQNSIESCGLPTSAPNSNLLNNHLLSILPANNKWHELIVVDGLTSLSYSLSLINSNCASDCGIIQLTALSVPNSGNTGITSIQSLEILCTGGITPCCIDNNPAPVLSLYSECTGSNKHSNVAYGIPPNFCQECLGSCCLSDGSCQDGNPVWNGVSFVNEGLTKGQCDTLGGTWLSGKSCSSTICGTTTPAPSLRNTGCVSGGVIDPISGEVVGCYSEISNDTIAFPYEGPCNPECILRNTGCVPNGANNQGESDPQPCKSIYTTDANTYPNTGVCGSCYGIYTCDQQNGGSFARWVSDTSYYEPYEYLPSYGSCDQYFNCDAIYGCSDLGYNTGLTLPQWAHAFTYKGTCSNGTCQLRNTGCVNQGLGGGSIGCVDGYGIDSSVFISPTTYNMPETGGCDPSCQLRYECYASTSQNATVGCKDIGYHTDSTAPSGSSLGNATTGNNCDTSVCFKIWSCDPVNGPTFLRWGTSLGPDELDDAGIAACEQYFGCNSQTGTFDFIQYAVSGSGTVCSSSQINNNTCACKPVYSCEINGPAIKRYQWWGLGSSFYLGNNEYDENTIQDCILRNTGCVAAAVSDPNTGNTVGCYAVFSTSSIAMAPDGGNGPCNPDCILRNTGCLPNGLSNLGKDDGGACSGALYTTDSTTYPVQDFCPTCVKVWSCDPVNGPTFLRWDVASNIASGELDDAGIADCIVYYSCDSNSGKQLAGYYTPRPSGLYTESELGTCEVNQNGQLDCQGCRPIYACANDPNPGSPTFGSNVTLLRYSVDPPGPGEYNYTYTPPSSVNYWYGSLGMDCIVRNTGCVNQGIVDPSTGQTVSCYSKIGMPDDVDLTYIMGCDPTCQERFICTGTSPTEGGCTSLGYYTDWDPNLPAGSTTQNCNNTCQRIWSCTNAGPVFLRWSADPPGQDEYDDNTIQSCVTTTPPSPPPPPPNNPYVLTEDGYRVMTEDNYYMQLDNPPN